VRSPEHSSAVGPRYTGSPAAETPLRCIPFGLETGSSTTLDAIAVRRAEQVGKLRLNQPNLQNSDMRMGRCM
jgi:hypothetical protein